MTPFNICQAMAIAAYVVMVDIAVLAGHREVCIWMLPVFVVTSGLLTLGKILTP